MSKILQANLEAALATTGEGGFGDDDGSSVDTEIQQIQIIKDVPKTKKKNQKKKKDDIVASGLSNVIYIGHIPVGFEEHEMRGFFNQFGNGELSFEIELVGITFAIYNSRSDIELYFFLF